MTGKPEVIIVGAGIAGLTLALELPRVGIGSRVYEPARRLEPLGGRGSTSSRTPRGSWTGSASPPTWPPR
ncbi:MAG: FAD-dependent monooxygenase [Micromonosporaceae bacterium]